MDNASESQFDKDVDAAIDQADASALMQERQMAMAIWKMMTHRKGRRKPHRSFACQELPEVAAKLSAKRRRLKKMANRARKTMYRNRH